MPTIIGVVFIAAAAVLFFQKDDKLLALVIFSAIFGASTIVSLNKAGIEPFNAVAPIFVVQSMLRRAIPPNSHISFAGRRWMTAFFIIAVLSALILPFVFRGVPVYTPRVGIDQGLLVRPPLEFTHTNISHCVFLLLDMLVVLGAAQNFKGQNYAVKGFIFTFYFLVAVIFLQFLLPHLGLEFPSSLIRNNTGVSLSEVDPQVVSTRYPGTFAEASGAGAVLACFTTGFLVRRLKYGGSVFPAFLGLVTIFFVRSSGSIAAVGLAFMVLIFSYPIYRFPFYINIVRMRRALLMIGVLGIALAGIFYSPLRDSFIDLTLNKQDSGSFAHRLASDAYALQLSVRTFGLGVGMGSNRPSSLLTSLLSTVGVAGLIVFVFAVVKLLSNAKANAPWLPWCGLGLLICLAISGPDFDQPWLWVLLALAVRMRQHASEGSTAPA
jgi:hypothetical protein